MLSSIAVSFGIVGALATAAYISKTKKFRLMGMITCLGVTVFCSLFVASLTTENVTIVIITACVMIIFVEAVLSIGLEYGCEVSYPVPENNVSGVIMSYSQILTTIQIGIASWILPDPNEENIRSVECQMKAIIMCVILISTFLVATGFIVFSKEDLRKTRVDQEGVKSILGDEALKGSIIKVGGNVVKEADQ